MSESSAQPTATTPFQPDWRQARQLTDKVLSTDRHRLGRRLQTLEQEARCGADIRADFERWLDATERSLQAVVQRQQQTPPAHVDESLPVGAEADRIRAAIEANQVVIVAGETGSGKTTQLPKICLQAGLGQRGLIGHTQPRRLAARSVANRIAEELQVPLGEQVGYQVRFTDDTGPSTQIKLMTDGILLAETQHDRFLNRYDTLIIDEAHERSLNIDFLLGYLKQLLPKRPDLKVIITSATIDVDRFSKHFDDAPVFEVTGRTYPVEVLYRPPIEHEDYAAGGPEAIVAAVEEIAELERAGATPQKGGDILVFLPGERDIREAAQALRHASVPHLDVVPLYARLSAADQQRVFRPGKGRRVVLSTNVAETSITVPGIHYVIDSGVARISRYSPRSKVQRLPIEAISQASANQRAGRCGRIAPGVCLRLYSEEDFRQRPEFTDAEILRTNLAAVILQMLHLKLGRVDEFPFLDPPDSRQIKDGYTLLHELQAVDEQQGITPLGRQLARLPVDPRLGRMLLEAEQQGSLEEALIAVSFLATQDPRERPEGKQTQAQQKHAQDADRDSDFATVIHLWNRFETQRQALGSNQLKQFCKREYLNFLRLREWREVHRQLRLMCRDIGLRFNTEPAGYESLHRALLAGLLSQIAQWKEGKEYTLARGRRSILFPGSPLYRKPPKWLMAAELVETTQLYARMAARIDPAWCEALAPHLIRRSYSEPHFVARRAQVMAWEQVTLYGLVIVGQRKVNYGAVDPRDAREIFIRQGLVEAQYQTRAPFFRHNQALLEAVETVEDKTRRRDLKVDDEALFSFYDARLPEGIVNGKGFEKWRREAEAEQADTLYFDESIVWQNEPEAVAQAYPDEFRHNGLAIPLDYRFEPGQQHDGVTAKVPLAALGQLTQDRLDWLVPGLLEEKAIALVRGLPKAIRRQLVPVPDTVRKALEGVEADDVGLTEVLSQRLLRLKGVRIQPEDWRRDHLEPHLQFNVRVVDEDGKTLAEGRDLDRLRAEVAHVEVRPTQREASALEQTGLTDWTCGDLPDTYGVKQAGMTISTWPALVDKMHSVAVELFMDACYAERQHAFGVARLARFRLAEQLDWLTGRLPKFKQTALYFAPQGQVRDLQDDLLTAILLEAVAENGQGDCTVRTQAGFEQALEQGRAELTEHAERLALELHEILALKHQVSKALKGKVNFALAFMYADIKAQLEQMVHAGFFSRTPRRWRHELKRYLEGMQVRLNRASGVSPHEQMYIEELNGFWSRYQAKAEKLQKEQRYSPELEDFRWRIEEYRISLFAQSLGTVETISAKRLEKYWSEIKGL
ncbi:ATP-dependent RNA helicase HrpA [Natronospirillum operosum]|uniref:ATP-dependent RNA helicase HrpA n=1 Tax=Natronospirillum operosum TaxID=2759953 RepID=A0A4Z0WJ79_9GAMM|nr:ATP-dependent RNA helicase HrpA [Natronospirillum operosum]TGG95553.1 ATP-dependent RNA helicase HrpA [Natronospirillum operosum]